MRKRAGVADMVVAQIDGNFDPKRGKYYPKGNDNGILVDPVLWEIRRERRMEFIFETQRLNDIRRWFKLDYMDNEKYPETMLGAWVDLPNEFPEQLDEANKDAGKSVMKEDGTVVVWNGSNQADMVGYAIPINAAARNDFSAKNYLSPVGSSIIASYKNKGFTLTQTGGWQ